MKTKKGRRYWLIGIILAAIGVVLARVVSQRFDQPTVQLALYAIGIVLALGGVGVIMYGIRKGLQ
jgi:hypothetical protein